MAEPVKDSEGNEYTNKFAKFLGKLNNEVKDMDKEAKMIPVNVSMKMDSVGEGFFGRLKKVLSVFKRRRK